MPYPITAVVSGSIERLKPEIDQTIDILEQTRITVLEPPKGRLVLPPSEMVNRLRHGQILPLPTEEALTTREIEDRFLRAMGSASLVYLRDDGGIIGDTVAFELGHAITLCKPVYAFEPLDLDAMEVFELDRRRLLTESITVLPPELVADHYRENWLSAEAQSQ
jgi:hypothetical protein